MSASGTIRQRIMRDKHDLLADDLLKRATDLGATPVGDCVGGCRVTVSGVLRSVSLRPRARVPAVEAELYDGSGTITIVWLGRRRIEGVEPGRRLRATGRITGHEGSPKMFNPNYELGPAHTS